MSKFDENKANTEMDRYSRAIAALGVETMQNLGGLDVLVLGQQGVGVEVAKNLCLAGPRSVTIWDDEVTQIADLGTNFYLRESDVKTNTARAAATLPLLAELNPYVQTRRITGELTAAVLESFGCVVVTITYAKAELIRINEVCRNHKDRKGNPKVIPFLFASTHGVCFNMFSDFGDNHKITDKDGVTIDSMVIEKIDEFGVVTVGADRHNLSNGDHVKFSDIEGATYLNELDQVRVRQIYRKHPDLDTDGKQKTNSKGELRWRNKQVFNQFQIDLSDYKELGQFLDNKAVSDQFQSKTGFTTFQRDASGALVRVHVKKLNAYTNGGIVDFVKPTSYKAFRSFQESLTNPAVDELEAMMNQLHHIDSEQQYNGQAAQLHFAFLAVLEFEGKHGRKPALHSYEDAKTLVTVAEGILEQHKALGAGKALIVDSIDADVITKYSLFAGAELSGSCAFLGGALAQEVVKKFGKYTPLYQWLVGDYFELLPNGTTVPENATPQNCRYDHQIAIFGNAVQDKILKAKVFLVGVGALGCEYIKGLALMGVGADKKKQGVIHITDMDRIELSNLSRQFLFRQKHVGKPKSVSAAGVAVDMNPDMNLVCHETKVAPETENLFTDEFWDSLDLCWNALDNVHARLYTDGKCQLHSKPLLESGTEGCLCNSSVHLPHQTPAYGDTPMQETGKIPACTLRNFPHLIVHCIEWARPRFESLFEFEAKTINTIVSDPEQFFEQTDKEPASEQIKIYNKVQLLLESSAPGQRTFETCVRLAFREFSEQFHGRIKDLIFCFPADARMTRDVEGSEEKVDLGAFWTGKKRFPQVADLDLQDDLNVQFMQTTANLYAYMFGLPHVRDVDEFVTICQGLNLAHPEWVEPAEAVDISDDGKKEGEEDANAGEDAKTDDTVNVEKASALRAQLVTYLAANTAGLKAVKVADFEKDDDTNFHIDFITSCSNMRAWNYKINPCTRLKAKVIAGKIIAALASTTAMITGLTALEFYKIMLGLKKIPADKEAGVAEFNPFYNANCNLAISMFNKFSTDKPEGKVTAFDEVMQCEVKAVPEGWTSWDYVVFDKGDVTIEEYIDMFPEVYHGCLVEDVSKDTFTTQEIKDGKGGYMFQEFALDQASKDIYASRKKRKLREVYAEMYGELPPNKKFILLGGSFTDGDGDEVNIPPVKFCFNAAS